MGHIWDPKNTSRLKVKDEKKIYHANNNHQRTGMATILITDKVGFKTRIIAREKDGHFLKTKGQ